MPHFPLPEIAVCTHANGTRRTIPDKTCGGIRHRPPLETRHMTPMEEEQARPGSGGRETGQDSLHTGSGGDANASASPVCSPGISRQFSLLILVVFSGLIISMELDRGAFFIWQDPLSDLGAFMTVNETVNVLPRLVFDAAMTVSGLLMLRICSSFAAEELLRHRRVKQVMAFLCCVGFFMVLMPYDVNLLFHEIGASLVFGMMWGITVLFSVELKQASLTAESIFSQLVLQGTVLPYAYMFAARIPGEVVAQKFAVIGLMLSVWYTTRFRGGKRFLSRGTEAR